MSYGDNLWLCGGQGPGASTTTIFSDVWFSPEGRQWTQVDNLPAPRWGHSMVSFLGFMFVVGGAVDGNYTLLYSNNGFNWDVAPGVPNTVNYRAFFGLSVFNDAMFVTAGETPGAHPMFLDDVWTWSPCEPVADCAQFEGRAECQLLPNLTATCVCKTPYTGGNCTTISPFPPAPPPPDNNAWIIVAALCGVAVFLLVCIVAMARRRRETGAWQPVRAHCCTCTRVLPLLTRHLHA